MRVVITGASGLLGKHLNKLLKEKSFQTVLLSRSKIEGFIQTNYTTENLRTILEKNDIIVHLAANRSSSQLITDFFDDLSVAESLYEVAREKSIKNIVFASSISVYSDGSQLPWAEDTSIQPVSTYGIVKRTIELMGEQYNHKHGMAIKNLRLAHIFGPNEKNNYMINLFMRKAFNQERITLNTASHAKREFLYVKDACRAIYKAILRETLQCTVNIGSSVKLTNLEVAEHINEVFENTLPVEVLNPDLPDNVKPSYMVSELSHSLIDYQEKYSFISALKEIKEELEGESYVPTFY